VLTPSARAVSQAATNAVATIKPANHRIAAPLPPTVLLIAESQASPLARVAFAGGRPAANLRLTPLLPTSRTRTADAAKRRSVLAAIAWLAHGWCLISIFRPRIAIILFCITKHLFPRLVLTTNVAIPATCLHQILESRFAPAPRPCFSGPAGWIACLMLLVGDAGFEPATPFLCNRRNYKNEVPR
jgi:hypothetical protein